MPPNGYVVDASVLVHLLAAGSYDELLKRRLTSTRRLHAPAHVSVEVLSGIRGLTHGRKLSNNRAEQAIDDFLALPIHRHPVEPLTSRIWRLRSNFTVYDAAYVALTQILGSTLLTCDKKIANASPPDVSVVVIPS